MVELTALNIDEILSDEVIKNMIEATPEVLYDDETFTVSQGYMVFDEDDRHFKVDKSYLKLDDEDDNEDFTFGETITFDRLRNAYKKYFYALAWFMKGGGDLDSDFDKYIDGNGKEKDGKLIFTPLDEMLPLDNWGFNDPSVQPLRDAYKNFEYELKFLSDLGVEMEEFEGSIIKDNDEDEDED